MSAAPTALSARIERERQAWNDGAIIAAQGYKRRWRSAFINPHWEKMEGARSRLVQLRCAGAIVLDYGCFDGRETGRYLDHGATQVHGIDISEEAIAFARASDVGRRVHFTVADAHRLPFPDSTFDLVVGRAILHHLDLATAFAEINRVLRPGGVAMFVEPLRGNPMAKIIRWLTPRARTKDERPLDKADIELGNLLIGGGQHRYSGFVSAPLGALNSLLRWSDHSRLMHFASFADELAAKTCLRYWGRVVYLDFHKKDKFPTTMISCR